MARRALQLRIKWTKRLLDRSANAQELLSEAKALPFEALTDLLVHTSNLAKVHAVATSCEFPDASRLGLPTRITQVTTLADELNWNTALFARSKERLSGL